ncbi:MAG: VPDSG-CTERM sorting domain-containing protein [Polyangiaceae bacterium]|jgi:hypothetical protein|nr:VPDSG-CTERM sorting domain-containing protein [Polyangiaceae bacterium]
MKKFVLSVMVVAALGWGSVDAQAAYIGGIPGPTGINDVLIQSAAHPTNPFPALEGIYGANLYLIAGAQTLITVEYMGYEAGYDNYFYLNGNPIIFNKTTPVGAVAGSPFLMTPGLMTFAFQTPYATVTNGSNLTPPGIPNFFLTLSPNGTTWDTAVDGATYFSGQSVILALDDGGAGIDDNHDDLVVKLTISGGSFSTPDGGTTLALLGGALLGLGALRRKLGR